jgi:hypothetical protein
MCELKRPANGEATSFAGLFLPKNPVKSRCKRFHVILQNSVILGHISRKSSKKPEKNQKQR